MTRPQFGSEPAIVSATATDTDAMKNTPVKILGALGMADENFGDAVRKEDTRLLEMLNEGLTQLMASPQWAELKKKYELE